MTSPQAVPVHSSAVRESASIPDGAKNFPHLPDCALIGSDTVRCLFGGITDVTAWRWVRDGRLPKPIKAPGGRANLWRVADIRQALNAIGAA